MLFGSMAVNGSGWLISREVIFVVAATVASSVAMACAAMASPRPIASTPSLVLAFRLIAEAEIPNDFASASRMAGKCGPSFGFLGDDDGINVRNAKLAFGEQFASALQKSQARHILPLRIGVRKMGADVAQPGGAEQSVADGMRQRVAVGMAHGPLVKRDLNAAKDQFAAFGEAVQVISDSRGSSPRALLAEIEFREFHVTGTRNLQIAFGSDHDVDIVAHALDQARFVRCGDTVLARLGKRFEQQGSAENLRSLREHHALARYRGGNQRDIGGQAGALHFLYRVHCRNAQNGRVACGRFGNHALDLVPGNQGPHRIVHQYQVGIAWDLRQRIGDGILA